MRWAAALLAVSVAFLLVVAGHYHVTVSGRGEINKYGERAYAPQTDRVAEWTGDTHGPLPTNIVDEIARNTGTDMWTKWAANFSISDHFADTRRLVSTAKLYGNNLHVFEYFSASFWFDVSTEQWGSYGKQFQSSWLLRDHNGQTIPFYGIRRTSHSGYDPKGHLVDLRNPAYRAWAVRTMVSWMKEAPYAGIVFDNANPLLDSSPVRPSLGDGEEESYAMLLCGTQSTPCPVMTDWNAGLVDLFKSTTTALHVIGRQVFYNGIAPTPQRSSDRNVGLLEYTDGTVNESFCATVNAGGVTPESIPDDVALMRRIAADHKKVIEITNYEHESLRNSLGEYCLAGFLMGWQPGSSYYVDHTSYSHAPKDVIPAIPEQKLQLGNPRAQAVVHGSVLTRPFEHGFVAVNTGASSAQVRVPITGVQFANGGSVKSLQVGSTTTLGSHSALYLLSSAYLNG